MDKSFCWFKENCVGAATKKVTDHFRQEKWNAFGLVDMSGNLSEWCEDSYRDNYNNGPYDLRPHSDNSGKRSCRGGSWLSTVENCRSAARSSHLSSYHFFGLGLRVARSID